jgi:hypothetical protein
VSWPSLASSLTTLTLPPLSSFWSILCLCSCAARECVSVCVCAAFCAPHDGSPRDLWLCVSPRWPINVNVNTPELLWGSFQFNFHF